MPSAVGKVLVVNREIVLGPTTVILVKEELGYERKGQASGVVYKLLV